MTSGLIKRRLFASEPLLATLAGAALGPAALGLLNPEGWVGDEHELFEYLAEISLAIAIMGVALRLPRRYPFEEWRSLAALLAGAMPLMWLSGSLIVYVTLGISLWMALLLGAVLTPTDPIVASAIVTGDFAEEHLSERVRHLISAESGANDGLAYPFVFLPIVYLTLPPALATYEWILHVLLWDIGVATVLGAILGLAAGHLLHAAEHRRTIENPSFLSYTVALSLFVLGAARLIGGSGLIAVFAAGIAFDFVAGARERAEEESVQEAFNRFFTLPVFGVLGLSLPWDDWQELGWTGLAAAVGVVLIRRLPAVLMLRPLIPSLRNMHDGAFVGWFGPIGVAALYYAAAATRRTGNEELWALATLVIAVSLVVHGTSANPLTRLYAHLEHNAERPRTRRSRSRDRG